MSGDGQLSWVPTETPEQIVGRAVEEHRPIATVALFSGGNDSTVLAHQCRDLYERLVFIDTGTAIPGVRDFVQEFATWLGKPLTIMEAGDAYRRLVLKIGFPGPAQHNRSYQRLKERQLERLLRELKAGHPRRARVVALSGVRRSESQRRAGRASVTRRGSMVFANPLTEWTASDMLAYRIEHALPQSDVAALLHRSGECNCGAFAGPGERRELQQLWPTWFEATIGSLEREVAASGIAACRWGEAPPAAPSDDPGPLCSDCQLRWELTA